jgi:ribonuclease G
MSEEVLINVTPRETRVALVENGVLQELSIERTNHRDLVGNIYKGRVSRILPGIQAAFVDIGLERAAFLHLEDITQFHHSPSNTDSIYNLLYEGQTLLVQVVKEPLGNKGARLTAQITIPSRYVVLLPHSRNLIGISTRISSIDERKRLKTIVLNYMGLTEPTLVTIPSKEGSVMMQAVLPSETSHAAESASKCSYGFIIRTVAEGISEEMLHADMDFLCHLWHDIQEQESNVKAGSLIYKDLSLTLRTIRDLIDSSVAKITVDSFSIFNQLIEFAKKFTPNLVPLIEYYDEAQPLFDRYAIDKAINYALERKVLLKSGGYLIIDQTEAMTTIDVNTGGYVGNRNLEETIVKTNLEAAQAIARQLRLRNLGGIIILDFIDMQNIEHKQQVLRTLEKCLAKDRVKSHISEVSSLGVVQMTRKRARESLAHILCETCPTCGGKGSIKTAATICYEIFRELLRKSRQFETHQLVVLASPEVIERMQVEEADSIAELEELLHRSIRLQVENSYSQEQYDVLPGSS